MKVYTTKPSRENTYESASMCGTWMLMKTHIYHILNMSIASCRPDAYETTHMKQQNENSKREQQHYSKHKKAAILLQHFYERTIFIATTLL